MEPPSNVSARSSRAKATREPTRALVKFASDAEARGKPRAATIPGYIGRFQIGTSSRTDRLDRPPDELGRVLKRGDRGNLETHDETKPGPNTGQRVPGVVHTGQCIAANHRDDQTRTKHVESTIPSTGIDTPNNRSTITTNPNGGGGPMVQRPDGAHAADARSC